MIEAKGHGHLLFSTKDVRCVTPLLGTHISSFASWPAR